MASIKIDVYVYVCIVESVFGTHPYCMSVALHPVSCGPNHMLENIATQK
jgi:hypothetical protein